MRISDWSSDVCSSDLRSGFGVVSHDPALFALPVPLLLGIALVVFFLALGEADFKLGAAFFPVQVERDKGVAGARSEEHTSELQSLMRISYAVFCLKKKKKKNIVN